MSGSIHPGAADQSGFTLIELVVAMSMGLIVMFAATALIINGLSTSAQVTGRVQATQEGQTGMETLMQQLSSGCLASDVSPVQAATASAISPAVQSNANQLVFVSGVGDSASGAPTEHVVSIVNGRLMDSAYASDGTGSPPALGVAATWGFDSTPEQQEVLMEHAAPDGTNPLFQYFSYANPANPTTDSLLGAKPFTLPNATPGVDATSVAEVDIDLDVEPIAAANATSGSAALNDSVTFRLTPAVSGSTNYPCD